MKKIIFGLLFCFISILGFAQPNLPIAQLENGTPVFTVNTNDILTSFTETIKEVSNIQDNFTIATIINYESRYLLILKGNTYKSAFKLDNIEGKLAPVDMTITCTTSACASEQFGCIPTNDMTPTCTPCGNGGGCTKTTSNRALFSYRSN